MTPWVTEPQISPFPRRAVSEWTWTSMNPGETMRPVASTTSAAAASGSVPTATIRSPRTPTSAATGGEPLPSTTVPPRISRSKSIG